MSVNQSHILILGLGPVQGLVGAARKARDAWAASHLLSTWARKTAEACREERLDVVVPPPNAKTVANKLVLQTTDPRADGDKAAALAREVFAGLAEQVRAELDGAEDRALWDGQVQALPEVWWAAAPIGEDGWGKARAEAEAALGERKHTRDFLPWTGREGVPKNTVDGRWESVLTERGAERLRAQSPGRVGSEEVLDLAGVLRRFWKKKEAFPSVLDIAVHPWLAGHPHRDALRKLADEAQLEVGELLLGSPARWKKEYGDAPHWDRVAQQRKAWMGRRAPPPYYAVIVADGDGVGRRLGALRTRRDHEEASSALAALADDIQKRVGESPGSRVIYAGGDDALVFAPLATALSVAEGIHAAGRLRTLGGEPVRFTVAIAFVHVHDSLRGAIALARDAEREAKAEGGDRLALVVDPRGGSATRVILPWEGNPVAWLDEARRWLADGEVPAGLGYELRRLTLDLRDVPARMIRNEVRRVLARKRSRQGDQVEEARIEALLGRVNADGSSADALAGLEDLERCLRIVAFLNRYADPPSEARPR